MKNLNLEGGFGGYYGSSVTANRLDALTRPERTPS